MKKLQKLFVFPFLVLAALVIVGCGAGNVPQGWSSPNPQGSALFYGSALPHVLSLNPATGVKNWQFPASAEDRTLTAVYSTPVVENGVVYFGGYNGNFYALDAANGQPKWGAPFAAGSPIVPTPLLANDVLYFGANNGNFYAVDAASGAPKWSTPFSTGNSISIWGDAAIDNGTIYFGSLDHNLYALDATTGDLKWFYPAGGMIVSTPLIANGTVYFGALNKLIALDATTGDLKWEKTLGDANDWIWADPTTQNGIIYVGDLGGDVYAVDAATGEPKWAQPFVAGGQIRSAIVLDNNTGYFGASDNKVYALNLDTAQLKWNPIPVTAPVFASPAVQGDTLFVSTHGNNMYAFNTADGSPRWCYDASTGIGCAQ